MNAFSELTGVINGSGLWKGEQWEARKFSLSPNVFPITVAQRRELEGLGCALFDVMGGLAQMATCVHDDQYPDDCGWGIFRYIVASSVHERGQRLQRVHPKDVPQMLTLNIMMSDDGSFKIADIASVKHGMGYATLGARFRQVMMPGGVGLPGTVALLADFIKGRFDTSRVMLAYSQFDQSYLPWFRIAAAEFACHGVDCQVVSENDLSQDQVAGGVFIDLPFLDSESDTMRNAIALAYMRGDVRCILPPKPFLGSASLLAFLRNGSNHPGIASLLNCCVDRRSLATLRRYIPETVLVGRGGGVNVGTVMEMVTRKRYVLKQGVASGMEGVHFSDDPSFEAAVRRASKTCMPYVLQEEVPTKQFEFTSFDERGVPNTSKDWGVRLTTHFVARRLAEITVTARHDKSVHGAPDCIQIGTTIVN